MAGDGEHPHLVEGLAAREALLQGHFLRVRRDTVVLPDGGSATREYVVHPGAVMVVPLLGDPASATAQVVLERQFRYPVGRVITEFPAGKRDAGEDLWRCAQRELREETGYTAAEWAHAGIIHPLVAYSSEYIDVWFARGLRPGPRQLDAGEFLDVFSAGIDELLQWCGDGRITDAKTLVASLWLQNLRSGAWSLDWRPAPDCGAAA